MPMHYFWVRQKWCLSPKTYKDALRHYLTAAKTVTAENLSYKASNDCIDLVNCIEVYMSLVAQAS